MHRIRGQADYCRYQAARCRRDAARINDPIFHKAMIRLASSWDDLAAKFELAENVSGLLQWNAQRLEPPEVFQ
jgi:hypothetical protein